MHSALSLFTLGLLATTGLCAPAPTEHGTYVLHEKRSGEPHAWDKHSRTAKDHVLPVRIGLKQQNLDLAEEYINDVAHPDSPNYGKHWTPEQIAKTFEPAQEATDKTVDWLVSSGISVDRLRHSLGKQIFEGPLGLNEPFANDCLSLGKNWIEFNASIAEAERLFDTEYHYFEQKMTSGFRIACDSYSLPSSVRPHVDFVMPTIQLDGLKPVANVMPRVEAPIPLTGLTGLAHCNQLITIECLRALYNFPAGHTNHTGNQLGIAEWADYLYLPDLASFFKNWTSPKIPTDVTPEFISIDGGKRSNLTVAEAEDVIESALDFQTSYSIIYPQGIRLYQNGDSVNVDSVGTFNIFLDALDASYCTYLGGDEPYLDPEYPDPNEGGYTGPLQCGGAPKSNVFSVSYGQIEGALPRFYQERQCHEWMKLALQGVSVVYASGDSGVANRYNAGYNNSCLTIDEQFGGVYVDSAGKRFSPSFPVNCPYITAGKSQQQAW